MNFANLLDFTRASIARLARLFSWNAIARVNPSRRLYFIARLAFDSFVNFWRLLNVFSKVIYYFSAGIWCWSQVGWSFIKLLTLSRKETYEFKRTEFIVSVQLKLYSLAVSKSLYGVLVLIWLNKVSVG